MDEETLFHLALERPADERDAFLDEACGDDAGLRQRVRTLLGAHEQPASFLNPAGATAPALDVPRTPPGTVIGRYKLLEPIGEGGYGTVFMAEQTAPVHRKVALKIIKPGMDTRLVIARFEAERQALALMDHPNIAKVFDAGVTDGGRPYFVMELVKGTPITRYCDEHRLTPPNRLELFVQVCHAVQHAHQKGIIHRDLKPTNVLVTQYDGNPVPKVIDFGVAKATGQQLTERTLFTGFGDVIGTPQYMSPEQAELNQLDVDTRSDIYSLGVLLYELLTGTTPLESKRIKEAALLEVLRVIREEEPPRPSTRLSTMGEQAQRKISAQRQSDPIELGRLVRGELDWIVMKALEKERSRRYETAIGLARDIDRYLRDEPVEACPPSVAYRLRKFTRRNKATLVTMSIAAIALLFAVGSLGWMVRDRTARHAKVAAQVDVILTEVDQLQGEQKWAAALASVARAQAAVAGGEADPATARRVRERLRDLEFVDQLEQVRMQIATWVAGQYDYAGGARAYARAFREYGVDVESLAVETSIERLKARPLLAIPVAAALDAWARETAGAKEDAAAPKRLLAVARGIDPEPLRDRLRSTYGKPASEVREEVCRLAESIDVRKHHPATLVKLAHLLRRVQREDLALRLQRDALLIYPGDFWLNHSLASLLVDQNDLEGAVRYYTAAMAIRPNSVCALNDLGLCLRDQKKLNEAVATLRRTIELDPEFTLPYLNLGRTLRDQGKADEAIATIRKAIEINPKDADAYTNLGYFLKEEGKLDEAIAAYRKAIGIDPKDAYVYASLGFVLKERGKLDEAIAAYRKAIEVDPEYAHAYNNLGFFLKEQGKLDEAIAAHRKAIEIDPVYADAYSGLGFALRAEGKLDEAIAAYRKAIEIDPTEGLRYSYLGSVLKDQGKLDEAIAAYRKAIEINPKIGTPYNALAWLLATCSDLKLRDPALALTYAKKATEIDPANSGWVDTLGAAYYRNGDWKSAIAALEKSMELKRGGNSPWRFQCHNWFFLAMSHWQLGNSNEARRWYDKAIQKMDEHATADKELIRFRAEAAALLGVNESK